MGGIWTWIFTVSFRNNAFGCAERSDFFADRGLLSAEGRMVHDMYLLEVKKPEESRCPSRVLFGSLREEIVSIIALELRP
jgi:hypothetical protein